MSRRYLPEAKNTSDQTEEMESWGWGTVRGFAQIGPGGGA